MDRRSFCKTMYSFPAALTAAAGLACRRASALGLLLKAPSIPLEAGSTCAAQFVLDNPMDHPLYFWPKPLLNYTVACENSIDFTQYHLKCVETGEVNPFQVSRTGPVGSSMWDNIVANFNQKDQRAYGGPGGWNDLDSLSLGHVAYVFSNAHPPHAPIDRVMPPPLTPDEQYTHITLWSLLASPLMIGGDLTTLDQFTLSLLTNDEVIDVNQDPLEGRKPSKLFKQVIYLYGKKISKTVQRLWEYSIWGVRKRMLSPTGSSWAFMDAIPYAICGGERTLEVLRMPSERGYRRTASCWSAWGEKGLGPRYKQSSSVETCFQSFSTCRKQSEKEK